MEQNDIEFKFFMLKSVVETIKENLLPDLKTRYYEFLTMDINQDEISKIEDYLCQFTNVSDSELPCISKIQKDLHNLINIELSENKIIDILQGYSFDKVLPVVDRILTFNKVKF